jgi:hypothetical protein
MQSRVAAQRERVRQEDMSPAHHEPEGLPAGAGNGLTVLTVREGEASIRDFRFDCRGETSCRAELGELLQLLERRHADIAIFLAHPNLVTSLIEELRRRGKELPEMVIASPTDAADARVTVSVSLSGLSESAYPQELLARLYEALRAAQGGGRGGPGGEPGPAKSDAEHPPVHAQRLPEEKPKAGDETRDARTTGNVTSPAAGAADDAGDPGAADVDELRARLERVLNQRLQRSQP